MGMHRIGDDDYDQPNGRTTLMMRMVIMKMVIMMIQTSGHVCARARVCVGGGLQVATSLRC